MPKIDVELLVEAKAQGIELFYWVEKHRLWGDDEYFSFKFPNGPMFVSDDFERFEKRLNRAIKKKERSISLAFTD